MTTTNRLMCDRCNKTLAHYSFKNTEHEFMEQLNDFLCPNCDTLGVESKID